MKYTVTLNPRDGQQTGEVLKIEADDCNIEFTECGGRHDDGNNETTPVAYNFITNADISIAYVRFDAVLHIIGQK